ncbi:MAG: hypothetical protein PF542_05465 [Nanoarchaeota archaeon]|jgi:hypothetical protein|nr:hypothetical protein [Nanoarchaeota archaeon]
MEELSVILAAGNKTPKELLILAMELKEKDFFEEIFPFVKEALKTEDYIFSMECVEASDLIEYKLFAAKELGINISHLALWCEDTSSEMTKVLGEWIIKNHEVGITQEVLRFILKKSQMLTPFILPYLEIKDSKDAFNLCLESSWLWSTLESKVAGHISSLSFKEIEKYLKEKESVARNGLLVKHGTLNLKQLRIIKNGLDFKKDGDYIVLNELIKRRRIPLREIYSLCKRKNHYGLGGFLVKNYSLSPEQMMELVLINEGSLWQNVEDDLYSHLSFMPPSQRLDFVIASKNNEVYNHFFSSGYTGETVISVYLDSLSHSELRDIRAKMENLDTYCLVDLKIKVFNHHTNEMEDRFAIAKQFDHRYIWNKYLSEDPTLEHAVPNNELFELYFKTKIETFQLQIIKIGRLTYDNLMYMYYQNKKGDFPEAEKAILKQLQVVAAEEGREVLEN